MTLDRKLAAALSEEERRIIDDMPDYKNIFTLMKGSLHSKMRPFVILGMVLGTIMTAFAAYATYRAIVEPVTQAQIGWALGAVFGFIWVASAKVWFWMQLERQAVLMELKRAELRILAAMEQQDAG